MALGVFEKLPAVFDEPAGAVVFAPFTALLPDLPEVEIEVFETGGTAIVLAAPGVGMVVHCHKPSALTQA